MAKTKAIRGPARNSFDARAYGLEPDLSKECSRIGLAHAYSWYNYFFDAEMAKQFLLTYMKDKNFSKSDIKAVQSTEAKYISNHIGWNARILSLGGLLPDDYKERFNDAINKLVASNNVVEAKEETPAVVINIHERVREKTRVMIAEVEAELDKYYKDPDYEFSMTDFFSKRSIKPVIANAIAEYYIPLFNELIDVLDEDGPDDLKEGYRSRDRDNIIGELKMIQGIIEDAQKFSNNQKIARKPRAKKEKSVDKIVAKIKYKPSDDKYKITSVRPMDIVGADQLWTFNTKTRLLGVYKSDGPSGLSVKGSKIIGYNEKESFLKKLRKPEDTLKALGEVGKVQLRKFMDNINSKPKATNGRINTDTVLVKVVK